MDQFNENSNTSDNLSSFLSDTLIVSDVKFNNGPLEEEKKLKKSRKNELQEQQEEYDKIMHEQRYKQLMHLLKKSKFYSSYLINKYEDDAKRNKDIKTKKKTKRSLVNDENEPPAKKKKNNDGKSEMQEYISTEIKEQTQNTKGRKHLKKEEIEAELSTESDEEADPKATSDSATIVPKYFCGELRDYQKVGLDWLKLLYENALGGILADEMGLGKTIQVIALICHLMEERQPGPYLIIAPLSTIPNWMAEFQTFAPAIPVILFYGTQDERRSIATKIKRKHNVTDTDYKTQPVVITTYEIPIQEPTFFQSQNWRYLIIDEGHRIKNYKCKLIQMLKKVRSMNRLLLTGTPLHNNLTELWSLLNFLLPEIFDDLDTFEAWFDAKELHEKGTDKLLKQEEEKQVLLSLREILKPFMLRRMKTDVCLEIPPKKELVVYAPLTELQHDLYKAVLNRDLQMLSKIDPGDVDGIIPDVNGERPKRRCVLRMKNVSYSGERSEDEILSTLLKETESNRDIDDWKAVKYGEQNSRTAKLSKWKQYTDVTDRNRDYLVKIQFVNRIPMYKKIVNHPYLIHCPLDPTGLPKIDEDLIKSSGKLLVLDAMLAKLKERGHKVLLFSTMTMILDMIEDYLLLRPFKYVRLDGTMKMEIRNENIYNFNNDPDMFLFLISIRAGGVGLNLMAADTVIIYDSDWNPQVDIQAMARCHRIGQTKPVVVYKLCTKGTIDETIINRSETKRILEKAVMSTTILNKNALLELKMLMAEKEYKVVTSEKEVFTETELYNLLDRSDMITNNCDAQNSQKDS